jgi:phospholipase C
MAAPAPPQFKHIVIVVQENRTPDNIFGSNPQFEPGVDIATTGVNSRGAKISLTATPLAGCYDLGHSHPDFVNLYNGGKMNGANLETVKRERHCTLPANPQFKFIDNAHGEVQPYFDIATQYAFANRMFQTNQGPSFPAHQFLLAGTSAPHEDSPLFASENMRNHNLAAGCVAPPSQRVSLIDANGNERTNAPIYPCLDHPTLVDLLQNADLGWKYYINTLTAGSIWTAPAAVSALCGAVKVGKSLQCESNLYTQHVDARQAQVLADIAACKLPSVSWVIPDAADSDHAVLNKGTGPSWVASIVNAIGTQAACPNGDLYWHSTAILIMWDDWGGWYDHVPPYHTGGWGGTQNWGAGYTYGLRVPLLVVSAYTQAGSVDNGNHDFGSILRFVESNFGLGLIGPGFYADAQADDLSAFFTLTSPRSFKTVAAKFPPEYFHTVKRSNVGPDDD